MAGALVPASIWARTAANCVSVALGGKSGIHKESYLLPDSWLRLVADLRISCLILPRSASVSA